MTNTPSLFPEITTREERRASNWVGEPEFTYISLGAGVQSTTLVLMAANGLIPKPKFAIFADTRWEPQYVYDHLEKLDREVMQPADIELIKVENGDIYTQTTDPHYTMNLPLYTKDPSGAAKPGRMKRQCTHQFKLVPIYRKVRELLGGKVLDTKCRHCDGAGERTTPWLVARGDHTVGTCSVCFGRGAVQRVGQPPKGLWARQFIGFSADEIERVGPSRVPYVESRFPLIEGEYEMTREDCSRYMDGQGWTSVAKSACIGCPFHDNAEWRSIRRNPAEWEQAVAFDRAVRTLPGTTPSMTHAGYLHRQLVPLDQADIGVDDSDQELGSCSPYGCRTGDDEPLETVPADLDELGRLF